MKKVAFWVTFSVLVGFSQVLVEAAPGNLIQTYLNPPLIADDGFGYSVLPIGDNILVGAPCVDIPGAPGDYRFAGRAYLLDGSTGNPLHTFQGNGGGMFGWKTAAMGSTVIISAVHDNTNARSSGAVYLFDASTGNQLPQSPILNPTPQDSDEFGYSVAVVGNNIVVGARSDDTGASDAGAAYLFDGSNGNLLRTFLNPTPGGYDQFGTSVAALGNNILIGAPWDDTAGTDAGAVYLFDASNGNLLRTFYSPSPSAYDRFGYSVVVMGDNILIGAPYDYVSSVNAGVVYLVNSSNGNVLQTFPNPTPAADDHFGESIAVVGDKVLISAWGDDTGADSTGAAYLFDGLYGDLLLTLLNPTPVAYDWFGYSVAAVGNDFLIGAPWDNSSGNAGGAVYLFEGFSLSIEGDFEPDGDVDFVDFSALALAWLTTPGEPNWNPVCDISDPNDDVIDGLDLAMFANDWLSEREILVAWWKFDEGSGTTAYDSACSNDGTISEAAWTSGKIGGALSFDGVNDYVSCPNDVSLNVPGGLTISAWVYMNATGVYPAVVTKGAGTNDWGYCLQFKSDTRKIDLFLENANESWVNSAKTPVPLSQWTHIAAVYGSNTIRYYFNGTPDGSYTVTGGSIKPNSANLLIGKRIDGFVLNGKIDDLRIYNEALSPKDILRIYQSGL